MTPSETRPEINLQSFLAPGALMIGLFGVVLVFAPRHVLAAERFVEPKELVLHLVALAAALLCLAGARHLRVDGIDGALAAITALGFVSTLAIAQNPGAGWRAVAVTTSGAVLFWAARTLAGSGFRDVILYAALGAAVALAGSVLLEAYGIWDGLSLAGRAPGGTLGNRNRAAHLLVLAVPLAWRFSFSRRGIALSLLLGGTAVLAAAITLSRSRAAWLGLSLVLLLLLGGQVASARTRRGSGRRAVAFFAAVVLGICAAVVVPNSLSWRTSYTDTLQRIGDYQSGSGRGRAIQYVNTLQMVKDHPLLGVGPGNWRIEYPWYASPKDPSHQPLALVPTNRLPHGDGIGLAAERGLLALLLLVCAAGMIMTAAWKERERSQGKDLATVTAVLGALALLGAVDAVLMTPTPAFWVGTVLGALSPTTLPAWKIPLARWEKAAVMIVASSLAGLFLAQGIQRSRATYLRAQGNTPQNLAQAVQINPWDYETRVILALLLIRSDRCDEALPHVRVAEALFPAARAPNRLAALCASRTDSSVGQD